MSVCFQLGGILDFGREETVFRAPVQSEYTWIEPVRAGLVLWILCTNRCTADIGQVSAYTRKLYELPLGTSKGLLHFVQFKGSTKVIRY